MQIEVPDQIIDALRDALIPVIDRLIEERVEQRRPLLMSVNQVAEELSCSRGAVYGLIHGGHLEAVRSGRSYRVATSTLHKYLEELTKSSYERQVVSAVSGPAKSSRPPTRAHRGRTLPVPAASLLPASKPPRAPRPKSVKKLSKAELAESRCTVTEFAERWYGKESAIALLETSDVALTEETDGERSFRYGDLLDWKDNHEAEFQQWLEEFDPVLKDS